MCVLFLSKAKFGYCKSGRHEILQAWSLASPAQQLRALLQLGRDHVLVTRDSAEGCTMTVYGSHQNHWEKMGKDYKPSNNSMFCQILLQYTSCFFDARVVFLKKETTLCVLEIMCGFSLGETLSTRS